MHIRTHTHTYVLTSSSIFRPRQHIYTCTYTDMYMHAHAHIHVHTYSYIGTHTYEHMHTHTHTYTHAGQNMSVGSTIELSGPLEYLVNKVARSHPATMCALPIPVSSKIADDVIQLLQRSTLPVLLHPAQPLRLNQSLAKEDSE